MNYVIIGNGVAGTTAAERIRKEDRAGSILLLSEESHPFYSRIRLTDFLAGKVGENDLILKKSGWYEEKNIDLRLGVQITWIDQVKRRISCEGDREYPYDRLLLATGGTAFVPPFAGVAKEGIFTLRSLDDAIRIKNALATVAQVVLVGGGILGLEVANALRLAGYTVRVIEFFDRLLPKQMDESGSRILQQQLTDLGLQFALNARIRELTGGKRVSGCVLEDGRRLAADMVIISAGMRPRSELAKALGLPVQKGVVVDDRMETGRREIFAAGDLAEHRGMLYGTWAAAREQGEVAGINMAGGDARFTGLVPASVLKIADIEMASLGEIDPEGHCESITHQAADRYFYRKLVLKDNRLIGAILYGDIGSRLQIAKAIDSRQEISKSLREDLEHGNLDALG